jgi:uncharacterized protein (DUF362 family)
MQGQPRKVILRRCQDYDPGRIRAIIREGMAELGCEPAGRILVKPNVVTANRRYIHHSYTDPRVLESMVKELKEKAPSSPITIGECGGIGLPTRMFFTDAGYFGMARRLGVDLVDFDEQQTREVELKRAKWHKTVKLAKSLAEAEYKIWMPKLKWHVVTQFTNAIKLNIGILTHAERLLYHDDRLNQKIVDLLEVGYPDLIVTDAVIIGRGFESSPYPAELGALMLSTDPLAIDVVAARIMHYRPEEVPHLVEASQRGYGSLDLDDIAISGDVGLDELVEKTRGVETPFQELEKLDTRVRFYEGVNAETGNLCVGGCACSIRGVLGTAEKRYQGTLSRAREGAMVMGKYTGDVLHPGKPVALIGTCAAVEGRLEAGRIIRIKGCPPKVRDLMLFLLWRFGIRSPAFELSNAIRLVYHSVVKFFMRITRRFRRRARLRSG